MDLGGEVGEVELTLVEVESDEAEHRLVHLAVDTDMRFMDGQFVGVDGKVHQAVVGFV